MPLHKSLEYNFAYKFMTLCVHLWEIGVLFMQLFPTFMIMSALVTKGSKLFYPESGVFDRYELSFEHIQHYPNFILGRHLTI